jgi:hypothetical protein
MVLRVNDLVNPTSKSINSLETALVKPYSGSFDDNLSHGEVRLFGENLPNASRNLLSRLSKSNALPWLQVQIELQYVQTVQFPSFLMENVKDL